MSMTVARSHRSMIKNVRDILSDVMNQKFKQMNRRSRSAMSMTVARSHRSMIKMSWTFYVT